MDLSERLARHEAMIQSKIASGEGFNLPDDETLREEAEFVAGIEGSELDSAIAAERRYVEAMGNLISTRREADREWAKVRADPEGFLHRQGGLGSLEELLPDLGGAASDEYLLQAAPHDSDAAILYAYKFLVYGLLKLDGPDAEWWNQAPIDTRLGEALDLFEAFVEVEPEDCRHALVKDGTLAARVVAAMRSEDPLVALRADLL